MDSNTALPRGWSRVRLGDVTIEQNTRVGNACALTVLSSTKHRGLIPSDEYFKRPVHSHDLRNYKIVERDWFAYATNHLSEGSIGLQQDYEAALVSPIYTVFSTRDDVYPQYLIRLLKSDE